jgi:MFS family permease
VAGMRRFCTYCDESCTEKELSIPFRRSSESAGSRRLAPLRVRSFTRLATAYTLNEVGDWLGLVALSVLVFRETGSALALTGLFLAANLIPAFVAPVLTARIDRAPTRRALPVIYLVEGAIFVGLALFAHRFSLPAILALALADGVLLLSARALSRAAVATTLEPQGLLREGNAIVNVGFAGATAAGPALGGIVVAGLGVTEALLLDAASFAVIAALLAATRELPAGSPDPEPLLARVRAGLGYVWRDGYVRALVLGQALAFVFFATVLPIEVVYAKDALGTDDRGFGLLLASWGFGIFLGSLVFAGSRRRSLGLIAVSTAMVGLAYLGMAAAGSLALACVLSVVGGAGNGVQWVALMTAVQEVTDADLQARVVGLIESTGAAMPGIGFLLGGAVAALAGPRAAFVVAGGGVLVVLAAMALVMRGVARERAVSVP